MWCTGGRVLDGGGMTPLWCAVSRNGAKSADVSALFKSLAHPRKPNSSGGFGLPAEWQAGRPNAPKIWFLPGITFSKALEKMMFRLSKP